MVSNRKTLNINKKIINPQAPMLSFTKCGIHVDHSLTYHVFFFFVFCNTIFNGIAPTCSIKILIWTKSFGNLLWMIESMLSAQSQFVPGFVSLDNIFQRKLLFLGYRKSGFVFPVFVVKSKCSFTTQVLCQQINFQSFVIFLGFTIELNNALFG